MKKKIAFTIISLSLSIFYLLCFLSVSPIWGYFDKTIDLQFHIWFHGKPHLHIVTLTLLFLVTFFAYCLFQYLYPILKSKYILAKKHFWLTGCLILLIPAWFVGIFIIAQINKYMFSVCAASLKISGLIALVFIPFIMLTPLIKEGRTKMVYCSSLAGLVAVLMLFPAFTGTVKITITSGPNVQMIGQNRIAILWTTNVKSTGFVEYGADQNHLKRAYATTDGLIDADTTYHKVIIPSAPGSKTVFRLDSTGIENWAQNDAQYGRRVQSSFTSFENRTNHSTVTFYVLSDIHEHKAAYSTFLPRSDYDFAVFNGDVFNNVENESCIVSKFLKPLSDSEKGERPFYFVRGNHDVRGGAARQLSNYLALPNGQYFYTFSYGPVYAIVMDSGENLPDTDAATNGLNDFVDYRNSETAWLKSIYQSGAYQKSQYRIAFVHIPLNMPGQPANFQSNFEKQWAKLFDAMSIDVVYSGHIHQTAKVTQPGGIYHYPIIDGGGTPQNMATFQAVKVVVGDQKIDTYTVDMNGKTSLLNEVVIPAQPKILAIPRSVLPLSGPVLKKGTARGAADKIA